MSQPLTRQQDGISSEERDWRDVEEDVLARVKNVSQVITERVRKVIDETGTSLPLCDIPNENTTAVLLDLSDQQLVHSQQDGHS